MTSLTLFVLNVLLCFSISIAIIVLIKPLLRDVLSETCGTEKRAEFWVMFTQLMLVISPLLIVIFFAPTTSPVELNIAEALKHTLFQSLLGDFIALTMIAQVIWKSVSYGNEANKPAAIQNDKGSN